MAHCVTFQAIPFLMMSSLQVLFTIFVLICLSLLAPWLNLLCIHLLVLAIKMVNEHDRLCNALVLILNPGVDSLKLITGSSSLLMRNLSLELLILLGKPLC